MQAGQPQQVLCIVRLVAKNGCGDVDLADLVIGFLHSIIIGGLPRMTMHPICVE